MAVINDKEELTFQLVELRVFLDSGGKILLRDDCWVFLYTVVIDLHHVPQEKGLQSFLRNLKMKLQVKIS